MATLTVSASIKDSDSGVSRAASASVTTTGEGWDYRNVNVGTSEYTFTIDTGIGDAGQCLIVNRDDTNYVQVGFATGVYYLRILKGEPALIPLEPGTSALYLLANTAACDCEIYVREA